MTLVPLLLLKLSALLQLLLSVKALVLLLEVGTLSALLTVTAFDGVAQYKDCFTDDVSVHFTWSDLIPRKITDFRRSTTVLESHDVLPLTIISNDLTLLAFIDFNIDVLKISPCWFKLSLSSRTTRT